MERKNFTGKLFNFLKLTHEVEDPEAVKLMIDSGVEFKGTNSWILIFAILVASVGLNMNSAAVIIGAMLISPLMGPITGVGFSIATYNFGLFRKSLKNLGYAVIAAIATSFLYFVLTPIQTEYSELLKRTSPSIYDVFIATFGGLAGIVALTSKNKGNVIPGVAIATALMPPLCTAGYGLAIGNWSYFLGALYLFLINSVFIALSTMVVSQLLKFPRATHLLSKEIKNKNIVIAAVITITVLPSLYLGYTLVKKEEFNQLANEFVKKVYSFEGNYLLKHEINTGDRAITLIYGGDEVSPKMIEHLYEKANDMGLDKCKLYVSQGLKTKDYDWLNAATDDKERLKREVEGLNAVLQLRGREIDSLKQIPQLGSQLLGEIKSLFPHVTGCLYANSTHYVDSLDYFKPVQLVVIETDSTLTNSEKQRLKNWLIKRLPGKDVFVRY